MARPGVLDERHHCQRLVSDEGFDNIARLLFVAIDRAMRWARIRVVVVAFLCSVIDQFTQHMRRLE